MVCEKSIHALKSVCTCSKNCRDKNYVCCQCYHNETCVYNGCGNFLRSVQLQNYKDCVSNENISCYCCNIDWVGKPPDDILWECEGYRCGKIMCDECKTMSIKSKRMYFKNKMKRVRKAYGRNDTLSLRTETCGKCYHDLEQHLTFDSSK